MRESKEEGEKASHTLMAEVALLPVSLMAVPVRFRALEVFSPIAFTFSFSLYICGEAEKGGKERRGGMEEGRVGREGKREAYRKGEWEEKEGMEERRGRGRKERRQKE